MLYVSRTSEPLLILFHLKTLATKRIVTTVTAQVIQPCLRLERSNPSFDDAGPEIQRV